MERNLIMRIRALVLIVCYTAANVSSNKWVLDQAFEDNLDKSQLLWDKDSTSLITCSSLCNQSPYCRSFFYHPSLNKCMGSQSYKRGLPDGQSAQQGWKYYTKPEQCNGDYAFNETLGLCFKIHPENRTFSEAMNVCESEGAKPIIIRNRMEFEHVKNAVQGAADIFIGLRNILFNATITWKWWNGQEASYLNWDNGQPSNQSGIQYCVNAIPNYGFKYRVINCWSMRPFICQKNI